MTATTRNSRRSLWRWSKMLLSLIAGYLIIAYAILPRVAERTAGRHADLVAGDKLTKTGNGLPGDPLNLALVGSDEDVIRALHAAGWCPADPLSFESSVRISVDTVFKKPDPNAPVSNLFLFGRKEDLAFEKPVGDSPRERHHVRLWRSDKLDEGRPVWIGAATHDIGVELSHNTKEVTHRIAPAVDDERDLMIAALTAAKRVSGIRWIDGFQKKLQGHNGGGDPWHTDGRLPVITLPPSPVD